MYEFTKISEWQAIAKREQQSMGSVVWQWESERSQRQPTETWESMRVNLQVMREAVQKGIAQKGKSFSGLVGGDANRLDERSKAGGAISGHTTLTAATYALAVSEVNASMGRIVACPTAGSCGILPGALLAVAEKISCDDESILLALYTAAGIGMVIAENATIAGAVGGCQAECGSAAAMAAGAIVELCGGNPEQIAMAVALALKSTLGLVCDPVAGLVEVPCVKRNAFGAIQALLAADMALAGVESVIPADEVIVAMYEIGLSIPSTLRETSEGGLAMTPTGIQIAKRLAGEV